MRAVILMLLCLIGLGASELPKTPALSGQEIMERNFYVTKIAFMLNDYTMALINEKGQERVRKLTAVSRLQQNGIDSHLLMRFQFPGDVRGTGFLQLQHFDGEDDLWVYLPGLKKVRRLVANNKRDSFFGSEFSYGDFLLPTADKFRHTVARQEKIDGESCFVIESVPVSDRVASEYGYGKKTSWILSSNYHERRVEYADLQHRPLKVQDVMNLQQIQTRPARWWAKKREMRNLQTGYRSIIVFDKIDTQTPVPKEWFTPQSLSKG